MVGVEKSRLSRNTDKSLNVLNSIKSNKMKNIQSVNSNAILKTKCSKKSSVLKALDVNKKKSNDKRSEKQLKLTNFLILGKENLKSTRPHTRQFYKTNLQEKPTSVTANGKENYFPVWKTLKDVSQLKGRKEIDVYDIYQDEEMACEAKLQKKKVKKSKTILKKRTFSKKPKVSQVKGECMVSATNLNSLPISNPVNLKPVLIAVDQNENSELDFQIETGSPLVFSKQPQMHVCKISEAHPVNEAALSDVSYQLDKEAFMSQLADEIEKSFLIPQMTSTPTEVRYKPQNCEYDILGQSHLYTIVDDQAKQPPEIQKNQSPVDKVIDKDITLFESPAKKKTKNHNFTPVKHTRNCLFKENYQEISEEIETSVLKPNKSYHTPDNFKTHLVRTKRIIVGGKCPKKKSKEELEIEKMAKHFEEVDEFELCVE